MNDKLGIRKTDDLNELLHSGLCTMAYQPILELKTKKTYGFEALLRGSNGTPLPNPDSLFNNGHLPPEVLLRLDMACVGSALRSGRELAKTHHLFINIHSFTLYHLSLNLGSFAGILEELHIDPERIIFEISERTDLSCVPEVEKNLREFMKLGIQAAIDDIGASFNWLHHMLNTMPAFLKVDRSFIHDIIASRRKQALVRSLNLMSGAMGLRLVAEGVEDQQQAQMLGEIGVAFAQGYLFGRPQPAESWVKK